MGEQKIPVSVLVDPDTYDRVVALQKVTGTFSRSKLLREIIDKGLKSFEKKARK